MITGTENILHISEMSDQLIHLFEKHGLGNYFKPDNLKKIGRFTRLNTLLRSNKIDETLFIQQLNDVLAEEAKSGVTNTEQEELHFSAMLPCGLRNPFKEFIESFLMEHPEAFASLNYLIEGNVNHELSYYPLLDNITDASELPNLIMASDVNNFFHRPFISRFIETGAFEAYQPYTRNYYLEKVDYADPDQHFTMYTANMLVMAIDKDQLGDRPVPQSWNDILDPMFANDIIMRGEDNFFCNAVMLPFYKSGGMDAIRALARNIKDGLHPAEMVKRAGKSGANGAAIYILPYFFTKRIKAKNVEVVWPSEGAIASPVFLLVKKGKAEAHKDLLDFLMSKKTGEMLTGRFFPSIHPEVSNDAFEPSVQWLGWDFLKQHDIAQLKDDIRATFMEVFEN